MFIMPFYTEQCGNGSQEGRRTGDNEVHVKIIPEAKERCSTGTIGIFSFMLYVSGSCWE